MLVAGQKFRRHKCVSNVCDVTFVMNQNKQTLQSVVKLNLVFLFGMLPKQFESMST